MQNRSKFLQLTSTVLLEYIINENDSTNDNIDNNVFKVNNRNPIILNTLYEHNTNNILKLYTELNNDKLTNNSIFNTVVPIDKTCKVWYTPNASDKNEYITRLSNYCDGYSILNDTVTQDKISTLRYDTIRLHILSGYSFGDIFGFMLQVKTLDKDHNDIKLCNLLYKRGNGGYIFEKPMIIDNKIYDKYLEVKIPSSRDLRNIENPSEYFNSLAGEDALNLIGSKTIENVEIIYSTISKSTLETVYDNDYNNIGNTFRLENYINVELPYESESDKFNVFLEESNKGNYINFCCTWENEPITLSTINAFNTRIKLYSANGVNETLLDELYNGDNVDNVINSQNKWIIYHEITTSCYNVNNKLIETPQTYSIQQSFAASSVNSPSVFKYIPIIDVENSSDLSYITFEYTARLLNRYDGTQIVRKGALSTFNVDRYVTTINRLNVSSITNYKVFNKINRVNETIKNNISQPKIKYVKEYVNYNTITLYNNSNNIKLEKFGGKYLFRLQQTNENGIIEPLNLLNTSSYVIVYKDANNKLNEIPCTYSENMNLTYGQLEFNISLTETEKMMGSLDKTFAIKSKGLDGSNSTLIEINYEF